MRPGILLWCVEISSAQTQAEAANPNLPLPKAVRVSVQRQSRGGMIFIKWEG